MRRLAVLAMMLVFLFLGLVISNLLSPDPIDILGVKPKKDVFVMFIFGVGTLAFLAIYDVFAAFGSFRRRRELEKQLERLETEILNVKHKPPPPTTY